MGLKYKDPTTGQFKDISVKVADSLPIGTEVDYDGETVPTGWEQVDNPNDYSTEETKIGTWINGKPLYRKVFQLGSGPNSATKSYNIGINCNTITKAFVYLKETSQFINLPFVSLSDSTNNISYSFSSNNLSVSSNKDRSNFNVIAIVEYTKTTD